MRRSRWLLPIGVALFVCYYLQSRSYGVNSDAAGQALQAWDMLHGNVLLSGWSLSDVSFYTTELPEYMLVELVRGLGPDVVHVSAALTYTLLVLLAALLAKGRTTGREGLVRALIAAGIMVAPQLSPGTQVLLLQPDHTGTGVPILLLLLLLERLPTRWWVPLAALAGLTWVQVADSMATYALAIPVILICGARFALLLVRTGPEGGWRRIQHDVDGRLALAGVGSVIAAPQVLKLITAVGGFRLHPVPDHLAPLSQLPGHADNLIKDLLLLFGADVFDAPAGFTTVLAFVHLVGVGLVVAGVGVAIGRFATLDRTGRLLVGGLVIVLGAGLFGTYMTGITGTHEIAILLPYGAVLAGRLAPVPLRLPVRWARAATVSLAAVAACYLAGLGYSAAQPSVPAQNAVLATWLADHGLTSGLAGYWQANEVRLDSGGAITLAPLNNGSVPASWESKSAWFDQDQVYANFVVSVSEPPQEAIKTSPSEAIAIFGAPARTYHYGRYTIQVWHMNLLSILANLDVIR
jgi:hypothetical protein